MRITEVECIPLSYKMDEVRYNANSRLSERVCLLVKVHTDEGLYGLGESLHGGSSVAATVAVIEEELAPLVIGEDPLMTERIWQKCFHNTMIHARGGIVPCAISGIDTALWDIKGKYFGAPLYKLLGGCSNRVEAYASGGFYRKGEAPDFSAKELKKYCDRDGYKAVKMKVGRTRTPGNPLYYKADPDFFISFEEDLERVACARRILGDGIKIMVDANAAWDLHHAMRAGRFYDSLNVYLFEEPVRTDDYASSAILTRELALKVAGYESEQMAYNYARMITQNAVDVVQPDLSWTGGVTECKKISDMAAVHNKECCVHVFGSGVLLAASVHFSCGIANSGPIEMDTNPNPLRTDLLKDPVKVDADGFITVSEKPGIGVELAEDVVEKYRLR